MTSAASELDPQRRLDLYGQLRDILVDEQIVVPIATRPVSTASSRASPVSESAVGDLAIMSGMTRRSSVAGVPRATPRGTPSRFPSVDAGGEPWVRT